MARNSVAPDDEESEDKDAAQNTLPTDQLQNGPVMDRGCTDILCCLVFVAFLVGMVGAGGYGLRYGEPQLLMTAWDADGNGCGYTNRTMEYPYLYFPTIDFKAAQAATGLSSAREVLKFSVCVKKCPDGEKESTVDCYKPAFMIGSAYYSNCTFYAGGTATGSTTALRYETALAAGRYCVPSSQALQ